LPLLKFQPSYMRFLDHTRIQHTR